MIESRAVAKKNISNSFRGLLRISPNSANEDIGFNRITGTAVVSDSLGNETALSLGSKKLEVTGETTLLGTTNITGDSLNISVDNFNLGSKDSFYIKPSNETIIFKDKDNNETPFYFKKSNNGDTFIFTEGAYQPINLEDFILNVIKKNNVMSPGLISMYSANEDIPFGWLLCDGSEYSINDYLALYNVIGTTFGEPSGPTKFKVPDFRGLFPRGYNGSNRTVIDPGGTERNIDSDREFGSIQTGGAPNITGRFHVSLQTIDYWYADGAFTKIEQIGVGDEGATRGWESVAYGFNANKVSKIYQDISEIRPDNLAINFIIKT